MWIQPGTHDENPFSPPKPPAVAIKPGHSQKLLV